MNEQLPFDEELPDEYWDEGAADGWEEAPDTHQEMEMPFGKYAGYPMSEVPVGYTVWLLEKLKKDKPDGDTSDPVLQWLIENVSSVDVERSNSLLVNGIPCMPFGKYETKPMRELPKDYLAWLTNSLRKSEVEGNLRPKGQMVLDWVRSNMTEEDLEPEEVTDETPLWFGKHSGVPVGEVEDAYLTWLCSSMEANYTSGTLFGRRRELYKYIEKRLNVG